MAKRPTAREHAGLCELVERIRRVNPTGRRLSAGEERARYEEKARLQSRLIEAYPHEVRVRSHDDMPGVVSLSVPRLEASAAHSVLDALSSRARAWVEGQLGGGAVEAAWPAGGRGQATSEVEGPLARAARLLAEYDFECAGATLEAALREGAPAERRRALVMLLELYVDRLANDRAALALEPALRALEPAPEQAYELLGVAAHREGAIDAALIHLGRCRGERSAETLAAIAEAEAEARAFGRARRAWGLLLAMAAPGDVAPSPRVRALCEAARERLGARAACVGGRELEVDAELVRFVKEFAPNHPWLDERRSSGRAARARASARALLERAEALAGEGDFAGVERVLGALSRLEAASSAEDAARVEGLYAWAKERREGALAERALAEAAAGSLEVACRVFLGLSERAQARALAADKGALFATLGVLVAGAPGRPARALSAAAAAVVRARASDDRDERRRLLAPHLGLLEGASAFAADLRPLREGCPPRAEPTAAALPPPLVPAGPREVWSDGLRLRELDEDEVGEAETVGVAAHPLRVGDASFVVSLERLTGHDGAYDVALWPVGGRARPRRVRVEGAAGFRPGVISVVASCVIVADGPSAWAIDLSHGLDVARVAPGACDDASGRGEQPAARYRIAGHFVERLDAAGEAAERLELPRGVSPLAVVASPLAPAPMVLAPSAERPEVALWWRAQEQMFRSFALFSTVEHGAFVEAATFADRGVCVVSRRADGVAFLHTVWAERGTLRPRRNAQEAVGHQRLVVEPSGRRGWWARREGSGRMRLDPLSLRPDDA